MALAVDRDATASGVTYALDFEALGGTVAIAIVAISADESRAIQRFEIVIGDEPDIVRMGSKGNDRFEGTPEDDQFFLRDGNDTAVAYAGDDRAFDGNGAAGADTFILTARWSGNDAITDFTPEEDVLRIDPTVLDASP